MSALDISLCHFIHHSTEKKKLDVAINFKFHCACVVVDKNLCHFNCALCDFVREDEVSYENQASEAPFALWPDFYT